MRTHIFPAGAGPTGIADAQISDSGLHGSIGSESSKPSSGRSQYRAVECINPCCRAAITIGVDDMAVCSMECRAIYSVLSRHDKLNDVNPAKFLHDWAVVVFVRVGFLTYRHEMNFEDEWATAFEQAFCRNIYRKACHELKRDFDPIVWRTYPNHGVDKHA